MSHVPSALAFYRDRLGFEITFEGPEPDDIFFGIVRRGGAQILLKNVGVAPAPNCTRDVKKGSARWDAFVIVLDPDALAAEFVQHEGTPWTSVNYSDNWTKIRSVVVALKVGRVEARNYAVQIQSVRAV